MPRTTSTYPASFVTSNPVWDFPKGRGLRVPPLTYAGAEMSSSVTAPFLTDDTSDLGVRVAFFSRRGGVSLAPYDTLNLSLAVGDDPACVDENLQRVTRSAGFHPESITLLRQIHGAQVLEAGPGACGVIGSGDALTTRELGVTVGVLTADCVPVLLASSDAVAAVHAGWRGLVGGVIEAAVERLGEVRAAWIGPSIHACCYEVGSEVIASFRERELPFEVDRVDPARAAQVILRRSRVERVWFSDVCTSCDPNYYSFRRDGGTGRQGAFIAWL
jgi:polyphenol oxidase